MVVCDKNRSRARKMQDLYRPLDISKNEIRLLSFEDTADSGTVSLLLQHVSLNDMKPEYTSFYDENASAMGAFQICKAWSDRHEFLLVAPKREIHDAVARFTWGDYICLSYTWGDDAGQSATVVVNGVSTAVNKHLAAALRDVRESHEGQIGMKVWVDALCINQADVPDRNAHVLRVRDIFGGAFSVMAWTKEQRDLEFLGLGQPGEHLELCNVVFKLYGKRALEEILGVKERGWGVDDEQYEEVMGLVRIHNVDVLVFDQFYWEDSDDSDDFGSGRVHLRDVLAMELMQLFRKRYWSRLWVIQELAVSPTTSTVWWGKLTFDLSTLQAVCEILHAQSKTEECMHAEFWQELKPRFDLLAFISTWRELEAAPADQGRQLLDASIQELKQLEQHAACSLPQDKVYGLLGLFPLSVTSAVTIDYTRESADVVGEFLSAVPEWEASTVN
ncbi:heterokaryon incompatibility protein-domain-containing protein [Triangularia setosa]|uniref:Heterokaryon incompatibility protein-domain-containing protein n=1 Tax=Triangularia setosa TaxID=2587417 RepID=A0AAN7A3K9_9PEZI|nr:heterokaryon incompatibility protein-domain-containing protein [Podospora setosa]